MPYKSIFILSGQFLLAIGLLILPADFFNNGPALCLSVLLFDIECYACGLTRACMHLIHFQFEEALAFNRLVVVVFPLVAFAYAREGWKHFRVIRSAFAHRHEGRKSSGPSEG